MTVYVYEIVSQGKTFLASREIHWAPGSGVRLVGIFPNREMAVAIANLLGDRIPLYKPVLGSLPQEELDAIIDEEESK